MSYAGSGDCNWEEGLQCGPRANIRVDTSYTGSALPLLLHLKEIWGNPEDTEDSNSFPHKK